MFEQFNKSGVSSTDEFLKSVLDSAFYGILTYRSIRNEQNEIIDFECLYANDIAAKIINIDTKDLKGSRLLEVYPGNESAGLFDKYKEVVEKGDLRTFEQYYEGEDINKWFRISAVKLNDGFTVSFQDISEFKKAVKEVEEREIKYQKLFSESLDPIFIVDDQFNFVNANPAFQDLFEYCLKDLICLNFQQIFNEKKDFELLRKIILDQKKVEEYEVLLIDGKGIKKPCLVNCVSIYEEENSSYTYLGIIRDLSKRKQADKELIVAEKLSMTGKIARTIAHEIRNPLTNLTLALQQLKDEVPSEVEDAELYFNIIQRNADRIGNLITDLLNSSKSQELKLEKQSLNKLVKSSLTLVKDRMKLQSINLYQDYDSNLPDIAIDSDQFKVALLNLFINAIEAMKPDKGKLTVKTALEGNNQIKLSICDNGIGIPKDKLDDLFEPFFTEKKEGSGLGLTAVQNIVHSHKAKIEVDSELGKGTSFHIIFKVKP